MTQDNSWNSAILQVIVEALLRTAYNPGAEMANAKTKKPGKTTKIPEALKATPDKPVVETAAAKTKKPSKSAAIREALTATPEKSAAEIAKEVGVTPGLVYKVKATMKKKKKKGKPGPKPSANGAPVAAHAALDTAFEFVTKVGGLLHAEKLIAKLRSIKEGL